MQTFTDYPTDTREGAPRAIRLVLCGGLHDYLTFADRCDSHGPESHFVRYAVIGTGYGYLHNIHGDPKLWRSASSAYRAARDYRKF